MSEMTKPDELRDQATSGRPETHVRQITFTVIGPDAGPIATGLVKAFKQVAAGIEERHPTTKVKVTFPL